MLGDTLSLSRYFSNSFLGVRKKKLTIDDMIEVFPYQSTHSNLEKIEKEWNRQLRVNPKNPSVGYSIIRAYCKDFFKIAVIGFISESLMGVAFYLISLIIDNLIEGDIQLSLIYAAIFTVALVITLITRDIYQLINSELFILIRQGLSGLLYKKSVRLGLRSISE